MVLSPKPLHVVFRGALVALWATVAPWAGRADDTKPGDADPPRPPTKKSGELKKYGEVITKEARTSQGVFTVHRIDDKIVWDTIKDELPVMREAVTKALRPPDQAASPPAEPEPS